MKPANQRSILLSISARKHPLALTWEKLRLPLTLPHGQDLADANHSLLCVHIQDLSACNESPEHHLGLQNSSSSAYSFSVPNSLCLPLIPNVEDTCYLVYLISLLSGSLTMAFLPMSIPYPSTMSSLSLIKLPDRTPSSNFPPRSQEA